MDERLNLNFEEIAGGALQHKAKVELQKIAENILDMNTSHKKKRTMTIKLEFSPNENRDLLTTTINVTSSLVSPNPTSTTMLIGQDYSTGDIAVNELQSGTKGQMYFDPSDEKLKSDTGQDVEEIEAEIETEQQDNVIDYNAKKAK